MLFIIDIVSPLLWAGALIYCEVERLVRSTEYFLVWN